MILGYILLKTALIRLVASNLLLSPIEFISNDWLNINFGFQPVYIHRKSERKKEYDTTWATSAHTPNPLIAITIATITENNTAGMFTLVRPLKSALFIKIVCCIRPKALNKKEINNVRPTRINRGSLNTLDKKGVTKKSIRYKNILRATLKINTVVYSLSDISLRFNNALEKPLSISIFEKAIKTANIPIMANSPFATTAIRMMLLARLISWCPNLSKKLQKSEVVVFCFNSDMYGDVIDAKIGNILLRAKTKLSKLFEVVPTFCILFCLICNKQHLKITE